MDFDALRRAYEDCTLGEKPPEIVECTGDVLNDIMKTTAYDPKKVYTVTRGGILVAEKR